ncbi:MAG: L-serine ammonia-lyase [Acetobacteraceae bacterium]|nr:L-serine ammonia-lyase [Acetobacteraceae bacterium]
MIGVFELFRVGLGPSSSHTVGPMRAARAFVLGAANLAGGVAKLRVTLMGSLAWTGRGHATDVAVYAGLAGMEPAVAEPDAVFALATAARAANALVVPALGHVEIEIVFDRLTPTPEHPNTMRFEALTPAGAVLLAETWFSVGGGFVLREGECAAEESGAAIPYAFASADQMLAMAAASGLSIAGLQLANEVAVRPIAQVRAHLAQIATTMEACIERGLAGDGILPGGLKVRRRAKSLADRAAERTLRNAATPTAAMDHASLWAIAVNEENAAGGRVVTAPTNGAAGVIPAVLRYIRLYHPEAGPGAADDFLLAAGAIGGLAKRNASISGAEVGCQGEVGVACAMAAAGLASALGGTPQQVENAAEIGLEHHLGMTCDPIGGLVQIPCIERNAMGAVKAITAASLALSGDGIHRVSLDQAIATMRQTGLDMHSKYKETAQGGLAVHVTEC